MRCAVIKNIPGYVGCCLVSGGRRTRNSVSCLFLSLSLCICCALSSLQTHSLLLRPLPAGPGFSVDPLCSHLVKLQHTWRLASEVGENCLLLKFILKGLEITGNEERCLQSWEPVGTETLGHKGTSMSAPFAGAFARKLHD